MLGFSKKEPEDDFTKGYHAAEELIDSLDHDPSADDWKAQWHAVMNGHSQEYTAGYSQYFDDAIEQDSKPWYRFW